MLSTNKSDVNHLGSSTRRLTGHLRADLLLAALRVELEDPVDAVVLVPHQAILQVRALARGHLHPRRVHREGVVRTQVVPQLVREGRPVFFWWEVIFFFIWISSRKLHLCFL